MTAISRHIKISLLIKIKGHPSILLPDEVWIGRSMDSQAGWKTQISPKAILFSIWLSETRHLSRLFFNNKVNWFSSWINFTTRIRITRSGRNTSTITIGPLRSISIWSRIIWTFWFISYSIYSCLQKSYSKNELNKKVPVVK